eukprot:s3748_g9.t1
MWIERFLSMAVDVCGSVTTLQKLLSLWFCVGWSPRGFVLGQHGPPGPSRPNFSVFASCVKPLPVRS